jgi:hypothetical protein
MGRQAVVVDVGVELDRIAYRSYAGRPKAETMTKHERGRFELPPEALEAIRAILQGEEPDKLIRAFEYALGGAARWTRVIETTPTTFVCMAEFLGGKRDGLPIRAEMTFDLMAGEVKSINMMRVAT